MSKIQSVCKSSKMLKNERQNEICSENESQIQSTMKTKDILHVVGVSLIIIVAGLLFTGCASSYQAYPGSALPRQQVAVLKWDSEFIWGQRFGSEMTVDGNLVRCRGGIYPHVDGKSVQYRGGMYPPSIALLPGWHTIGFSMQSPVFINNSSSRDIYVGAGKTYIAKRIVEYIHNPRSEYGLQDLWSVEITEEK